MSKFSDDDLGRMLDEAASSYAVPEHGPVEILAAIAEQPVRPPVARRPWVQLSSAAAIVAAGALFFAVNDNNPIVSSQSAPTSHNAVKRDVAAVRTRAQPQNAFGLESGGGVSQDTYTGMAGSTVGSSGSVGGGVGAAPGFTAPVPAALAPAAGVAVPPQAPALPNVGAPMNDEGDSRVVKTGSIALVVKDKRVTPTLTAVERAARVDGGYIASGTTNEYGDSPSGELTIRVPVAKFEDLVAQVRALDAKVRTATTTGKDVTAAYSDLASQLKSLNATRDRFYLILTKTKTISEILTVQQRIDNVSGQIDRIEGQRKLLASQSDLATLTVSVSEAGDPVVKATT
jgi:hypothetical protein